MADADAPAVKFSLADQVLINAVAYVATDRNWLADKNIDLALALAVERSARATVSIPMISDLAAAGAKLAQARRELGASSPSYAAAVYEAEAVVSRFMFQRLALAEDALQAQEQTQKAGAGQ